MSTPAKTAEEPKIVIAPPPPEPPKPAATSKPEDSDTIRAALGDLVTSKPKKKTEPAKDDPAATPAAKKSDEPPAPPEKKPAPKKKAPAEPAAPSVADITTAVAAGVATALKKDDAPKPKADDAPTEYAWLSDKERKKLTVLEHMEKGLGKRYADGIKAVADYRAQWEKDHPGQAFDPAADEHNEFYAKHEVGWDEDEYAEAVADLRVKTLEDRLAGKEKEVKAEQEFASRVQQAEQEVAVVANAAVRQVAKELGGEYAKLYDDKGIFQKAVADQINAEDPIIAPLVFQSMTQAQIITAETTRLFHRMCIRDGKVVPFDSTKMTPLQQDIMDYAVKAENEMEALPRAEQVDGEGRRFARSKDFYAMPAQQRAGFWTFGAKDLNALRLADIASVTKKLITATEEGLKKSAARRGFAATNGNGTPPAPAKEETVVADDGGDDDGKPVPVTSGVGTRMAPGSEKAPVEVNPGVKTFFGDILTPRSKK